MDRYVVFLTDGVKVFVFATSPYHAEQIVKDIYPDDVIAFRTMLYSEYVERGAF